MHKKSIVYTYGFFIQIWGILTINPIASTVFMDSFVSAKANSVSITACNLDFKQSKSGNFMLSQLELSKHWIYFSGLVVFK